MTNKYVVAAGLLTFLFAISMMTYPSDNHEANSVETQQEFRAFAKKYQRYYLSQEDYNYRLSVFEKNLALIRAHNSDSTQTFRVGVNQFADMTFSEMKMYYSPGFDAQEARKFANQCPLSKPFNRVTENAIDWSEKGVVFGVKDQKRCGSCWAFSATAALESAIAIKTEQPPVDISEQELVDCSNSYGNKGCQGGYMHFAYNYILEHGINLSKDYPYNAHNNKCKSISGQGPVRMTGCVRQVPTVDGLVDALHVGPVAVGVFADILMYLYESGVFNIPQKMCDFEVDHGVLAVGFDKTAQVPYFKVKNSWGPKWGEQGYFKIAMGTDTGLCRLAGSGYNYYPVVN